MSDYDGGGVEYKAHFPKRMSYVYQPATTA